VPRPAAAVDDSKVASPASEIANDRGDERAEPSKPEVSRLGTTRQLEPINHLLDSSLVLAGADELLGHHHRRLWWEERNQHHNKRITG
jgi:hypothetical protein